MAYAPRAPACAASNARWRRAPRRAVVVAYAPAASPGEWKGRQFTMLCAGEGATAHLARIVAREAKRSGDAVCLKGDAGAGKSTFA